MNYFASIRDIKKAVARAMGVSAAELEGARRSKMICAARHAAFYLASLSGASSTKIGNNMGRRDHTTILHGLQKVKRLKTSTREGLRPEDIEMLAVIDRFEHLIGVGEPFAEVDDDGKIIWAKAKRLREIAEFHPDFEDLTDRINFLKRKPKRKSTKIKTTKVLRRPPENAEENTKSPALPKPQSLPPMRLKSLNRNPNPFTICNGPTPEYLAARARAGW